MTEDPRQNKCFVCGGVVIGLPGHDVWLHPDNLLGEDPALVEPIRYINELGCVGHAHAPCLLWHPVREAWSQVARACLGAKLVRTTDEGWLYQRDATFVVVWADLRSLELRQPLLETAPEGYPWFVTTRANVRGLYSDGTIYFEPGDETSRAYTALHARRGWYPFDAMVEAMGLSKEYPDLAVTGGSIDVAPAMPGRPLLRSFQAAYGVLVPASLNPYKRLG